MKSTLGNNECQKESGTTPHPALSRKGRGRSEFAQNSARETSIPRFERARLIPLPGAGEVEPDRRNGASGSGEGVPLSAKMKDAPRGWHRSATFRFLTRSALGFIALNLVSQVCWGAFQFPASKDLAQEWVITEKVPAQGAVYARIESFHQYLLVIPAKSLGVCDESGNEVDWCIQAQTNSTGFDLIFECQSGRRYYSSWNSSQAAVPPVQKRPKPAAKKTPGKTKAKPRLAIPGADDLPEGELEITNATPVFVPVRAGTLVQRLPWSVRDGVVRQTTRGPNVFLVSKSEWGGAELSVKVRPLTCKQAGIFAGASDPAHPAGGFVGLVGVAAIVGTNATSGGTPAVGSAPELKINEWNELRARIQGGIATLTVNGQVFKQFELPEDAPGEGYLGLAVNGGEAEFDDFQLRNSAGKILFADPFEGAGLDARRWREVDGQPQGGFVRIVNTGAAPATFNFRLMFHRDPWSRAVSHQPPKLPAKQASAWMWLPNLYPSAPITLVVKAPAGSEGEVLVARSMNPGDLIGRFRVADQSDMILEASRPNFTERSQLQTDEEIASQTLADVRAMTFKGKRPERFPTGSPAGHLLEFEAGRILGFTAVQGHAQSLNRSTLDRLGYRYIYSYTHLATTRGQGIGFKRDNNRTEMEKLAEQFRSRNLLDRVYRISVFDEPGFDIAATMGAKPSKKKAAETNSVEGQVNLLVKDTNAWSQMIANAGLTPADLIDSTNPPPPGLTSADLEYWQHLRLRTIADRETDPLGVYRTMGVYLSSYSTRFGNIRTAIREAFGTQVWVTANVHDSHFMKGLPVDIDPWMLYSKLEALDVPQACDYTVGYPPAEEFMIDLFRCALRPHRKPVDAYLASQARYMTRSPRSLKLRAFSALGAGAQSLSFYLWGPRYLATENWYDTDRGKLQAIGEINHAAGWVEDILLDGAPRQPAVVILWTRVGDVWDAIDVGPLFAQERKVLHHLLRNLQYQADIVHEDHLPSAAELDRYKVIFMSQRCMSPAGVAALTAWVERGGTLIASLACAPLDELTKPTDRMLKLFGLESVKLPDVMSSKDAPAHQLAGPPITTRGPVAELTPSTARVTASFQDGKPAVVEREVGRGRCRMTAFLLGHTYHSGESLGMKQDVLVGMNDALRDWVRPWLEPAGPPFCAVDPPLVSARLIESPHGAAVVLVNSTGEEKVAGLTLTLSGIQAETAESLMAGPLKIEPVEGGRIQIRLAEMGLTDVIRIR
jgi:hypothetical protein